MSEPNVEDVRIVDLTVRDIRFPTSREAHGTDAMHTDPNYSCPYVTLHTNHPVVHGYGLTFTLGRGNDVCIAAILAMKPLVIGKSLHEITSNFGAFYRSLTSDTQMRWLGPEKGVMHISAAAVLNAIWDLWGRVVKKPVWKILADLTPEQTVTLIDFRYITDVLSEADALEILRANYATRSEREQFLRTHGLPAYTTSCGWSGYSEDRIRKLSREALADGFTFFKMKVGADLQNDARRAAVIREEIGYGNVLAMDANQRWEVQEAIDNMKQLARFKPYWIEEPTSPDDVLGHATIAKALAPLGIGVATGEHCHNRIIFKQLLQANALSYLQIDSCRVGSVNENIAIILMAKKFNVPVCPHAGGVGLCEYVQHLAAFDFVCSSATLDRRVVEFVDHLHEHFVHPVRVVRGRYSLPQDSGYSAEMKPESLDRYEYPAGVVWQPGNEALV